MMSNKYSDGKPNTSRAVSEWVFDIIPECFPQEDGGGGHSTPVSDPPIQGGMFAGQENVHAEDQGSLTTPI
jgi:hypothetical protein